MGSPLSPNTAQALMQIAEDNNNDPEALTRVRGTAERAGALDCVWVTDAAIALLLYRRTGDTRLMETCLSILRQGPPAGGDIIHA
jgi:hypothetical protein